jgi:Ferredoxin-like domain in Api92-like protein
MPNHTANNFTVTGPVADVKRFLKQAAGTDKELSFNSLIPLPTVLRNVSSPVRIQPQEEINATWDEWYKRKDEGKLEKWELEQGRPMGLGITQDTYNTLIKEYGVSNWYDWSVLNWGTKWDCYDVREWSIAVADEEMTATIYYETAWSPATQVWLTVSQQYPTLTFFHEFADEGGGFLGDETIHNGTVIEENEYDWDEDDGITLREGLGRYWPEDEEVTEVKE